MNTGTERTLIIQSSFMHVMLSLILRLPSSLSDSLMEAIATSDQIKWAVQSLCLKFWFYMLNMYMKMYTDLSHWDGQFSFHHYLSRGSWLISLLFSVVPPPSSLSFYCRLLTRAPLFVDEGGERMINPPSPIMFSWQMLHTVARYGRIRILYLSHAVI